MPMASTAYLTVERRQEAKKKKDAKLAFNPHHHAAPPQIDVKIRKETCFEQKRVRELYLMPETQFTVAFLIFLNFISEAANAQVLPEDGSSGQYTFLVFEFIFNISFTIELAWNMYGSWFLKFWDSGWNWFDFAIVMISLLAMLLPGLPGISVLRLFRAFRVFRLFKRIKSLKKIIEGVLGALPGVSQAFLVLGILMGIWSVIGVEFFRTLMPEFFGNWVKAMYTMFQIMTMDSWSSGIARVLIYENNLPMASVFFISYIFIAGIVMTNVVVAILLDKYLEAIDKDKQEEKSEQDAADAKAEEDAQEDPTNPEVMIYVYTDGQMTPIRSITRHRFWKLQEWLSEAAEPDKPKKASDAESDSDSEGKDEKEEHVGGNSFFKHTRVKREVFMWNITSVLKWLQYIGFEEYLDKFRKDGINGQALTQLNEVDLINLGMKLTRRKQFMQALYELLSDCKWPDRAEAKYFQDHHRPPPLNSNGHHNNLKPTVAGKRPAHVRDPSHEYMFFNYSNDRNTSSRMPHSGGDPKRIGVQMVDFNQTKSMDENNELKGWDLGANY